MSKAKKPDNLFQRGKTWYIRYSANGRKIIKSLKTKNRREAIRLRNEILHKRSVAAEFGLDMPVPRKEVPFSEIAERWLNSRRASGLRDSTIRLNESALRLWLVPYFGRTPLSGIDLERVEGFAAHLRVAISPSTGEPLSEGTAHRVFSDLGAIYRHAIKRGWYSGTNPIERMDHKPRKSEPRDITLTEDEARALLAELSGETYYKVALALNTGLRWGEVNGLEWQGDITLDTDPCTLTVRRSFRGPPKNEASKATIPLNPDAAALLRRWRREQGIARYAFPNTRGEIPKARAAKECQRIKDAAERAGIDKNVTPHVFRHTFGTWVYERTGDPKLVQRLMRHAQFTTSMNYVHDRRNLADVVAQLPALASARLESV